MLKVELLDETHDRSGFDCGVEPLNRYIQQIARQHIAKGISKTFVLVDERAAPPKPVLGFFTISLCQVLGQQVPSKWAKKLPEQIPAMRLGRLAVRRIRCRRQPPERRVGAYQWEDARAAIAHREVCGGCEGRVEVCAATAAKPPADVWHAAQRRRRATRRTQTRDHLDPLAARRSHRRRFGPPEFQITHQENRPRRRKQNQWPILFRWQQR